ncbi:hypothetical protein [Kocuria sp. CNJ-770]|uniref:hypothetical protein n=1 Tax=Kocuria sp. CNJ-770 TaxID=1904964 RepID=UPI0021007BD5|nr:hypothetical protein [Kocuria sp. CNJ-770]
MDQHSTITVRRAPERHRYELLDAQTVIGTATTRTTTTLPARSGSSSTPSSRTTTPDRDWAGD